MRTGPYVTRIQSSFQAVADAIALLYGDYPLEEEGSFTDFQVMVRPPRGLRRWIRRQSAFLVDGFPPFLPLPRGQAYPMLEWGLNWCISSHCHEHLIVHAAVVEMNGRVAILPAPPGSGKSTLCATLVNSGWRLLSDELTLVRLGDARIAPLPRPVSLKNYSIELIAGRFPDAVFSPVVRDTIKGTVAHMKPPTDSIARALEAAPAGWIVFPQYVAASPLNISPLAKPTAFIRLAENAFNYNLLGIRGFETLSSVVDASDCFSLKYSRLDDALKAFAALAADPNE